MAPETLLVSVIVPAYQCAATLGRALTSVLQQDYPAIEIIVQDDGSTDAAGQVAAEAAARDPRIHYFQQPNQGPAAARNAAATHASGEYLAFLVADDEWLPGKLQLQADILKQNAAIDLVFTKSLDGHRSDGRPPVFIERKAQALQNLEMTALEGFPAVLAFAEKGLRLALFSGGLIHLSSIVMRRSTFQRLGGFDHRRRGAEDVDFCIRAARVAGFAYCAQPLTIHNLSDSNMSRLSDKWYQEIIHHLHLCLASAEYSDLHTAARQDLRRRYRFLIFYYGRQWQPRQAWAAFRASQEAGMDGLSAMCALGAWLGPWPFRAAGRLLWPHA